MRFRFSRFLTKDQSPSQQFEHHKIFPIDIFYKDLVFFESEKYSEKFFLALVFFYISYLNLNAYACLFFLFFQRNMNQI